MDADDFSAIIGGDSSDNTSLTTNTGFTSDQNTAKDINSSNDQRKHLAFVYGTLKNSFPNWKFMPKGRKYAGVARTTKAYPLVVGTDKNIPFMLNISEPSAKHVFGELYFVDDDGLKFLDEFEEVPEGFYVRELIEVAVVEPTDADCLEQPDWNFDVGTVLSASAYFRSPSGLGPPFALPWTVDTLKKLPFLERYLSETSTTYRELDVEISQSVLQKARDICGK